jgi:Uncharacterized protein conserved in bacteria (DUF2188)
LSDSPIFFPIPLKIDRRQCAAPGQATMTHLESQAMPAGAIHVVPDSSFDDWIIRADIGGDLGHYPTREEAERVAQAIARRCQTELVIHLPDGRTTRQSFAKGWLARLFGK